MSYLSSPFISIFPAILLLGLGVGFFFFIVIIVPGIHGVLRAIQASMSFASFGKFLVIFLSRVARALSGLLFGISGCTGADFSPHPGWLSSSFLNLPSYSLFMHWFCIFSSDLFSMSLALSLAVFKLLSNLFFALSFPVLEYSYGGSFLLKLFTF